MHTADQMMALFRSRFDVLAEMEPTLKEIVDAVVDYAAGMVAAEREACAKIAEKTCAHSAFHFELGTAVAAAIRNRA